MEHKGTNCGWYTWNNPQSIDKGARRLKNKKTGEDHPVHRSFKMR